MHHQVRERRVHGCSTAPCYCELSATRNHRPHCVATAHLGRAARLPQPGPARLDALLPRRHYGAARQLGLPAVRPGPAGRRLGSSLPIAQQVYGHALLCSARGSEPPHMCDIPHVRSAAGVTCRPPCQLQGEVTARHSTRRVLRHLDGHAAQHSLDFRTIEPHITRESLEFRSITREYVD